VVPGGGINRSRRQWIKKKGKYFFNQTALANVFRAKFINSMNEAGLPIAKDVTPEWVVHFSGTGKGGCCWNMGFFRAQEGINL
jgi:hypothetical protein